MSPRLDALLVGAYTSRHAIALGLAAVTLLGAVGSVLTRERCGLCGERLRVPLEAHWQLDHAGDR